MSPYRLIYEKSFHLPVEVEHKTYWAVKAFKQSLDEAGLHRKLQLQEIKEIRLDSFDNAAIYKEKSRVWHDMLISRKEFKESQKVLRSRWVGLYVVRKVYSHGAVKVENPNSVKTIKVNGQRLKTYHEGVEVHGEEELTLEDPVYND
ncbi:uncharacterized protein LOC141608132 [Silene latifolia]|uniref:uncharacterized protein LOC141608132 n=1 Tax=Silene latifolia TaxID=37657 RepID=UPI003D76DCA4